MPLGAGDGRACREHDFVANLVEEHQADMQAQRDLDKAAQVLRVMMGAATVRVMYSIHGVDPALIYARMLLVGHPPSFIAEVKQGVERLGGPLMSDADISDTVMSAVSIMARHVA